MALPTIRRAALAGRVRPRDSQPTARRWAVAGGLCGALLTTVACAPAAWLAGAVAPLTQGQKVGTIDVTTATLTRAFRQLCG